MRRLYLQGQRGFTLLESIILIVVIATVGTMMFTLTVSPFKKAADVNRQTSNVFTLASTMENIVADYRKNYQFSSSGNTLTQFQTALGSEGTAYNNAYGTYTLVNNHFITFNASNVETSSGSATNYLKVTIKNSDGVTFDEIFSVYQ
ncbi:MAG: type II secretion system GspH family protein [Candidatus Magnetominusculus sp. LBB02]|nr:type II secretion system GspH family protein [Candidatus Magnetominusculus sp. LBB02]